jgi:hypothetical protein
MTTKPTDPPYAGELSATLSTSIDQLKIPSAVVLVRSDRKSVV